MIQPNSAPLCLSEPQVVVAAPRAAMRAYLALVAALGGMVTAGMLMMAMATNGSTEADRIVSMQDDGYAATLMSALCVNLSKPLR
ncbi:hypothetical protein MKK75_33535 [Methylobacterium sp. J-030]|nr:hypothetical protein [Methylobacterium sp. J-030]